MALIGQNLETMLFGTCYKIYAPEDSYTCSYETSQFWEWKYRAD